MNEGMPFVFNNESGSTRILETRAPNRSWSVLHLPRRSGRADEDYAIVARIVHSKSGQFILVAAGMTTFGTQSAAECLVENDCIAKLTAGAPKDWATRNFEAVIATKILGNTPGPPRLVVAQSW